jgi:mono/diheme cytochrome c family protein
MRRVVGPPLLLIAVVVGTIGLALWHPFKPSPSSAPVAGDPPRGKAVFAASCAGCHGADASGGVGPALAGSGLTESEVVAVVAAGRGVMPAGLVGGQDAADVASYVASLSQ